ncbi:hypothetical protein BOTBODRAFT_64016 [Botryobasidium botryosum FD-172 SS1]|uniref:Uncharacterized protein n=1 Tax=Botryobasidium botryosum (strain FD-172 SS1) TaxID=930990 RepID=A0A067MP42_BOTB1|nr:hypothetical protein BOTBODRAFT_64016 [Botryobasidium botryosum FD-172 SS1]
MSDQEADLTPRTSLVETKLPLLPGIQSQTPLLAPIYRLPPDILLLIFHSMACAVHAKHRDSIRLLISLLTVSRMWRRVTLKCFELWTRLYAGLPEGVFGTFLNHSRSAPLEFHFVSAPSLDFSQYLSLLSPHRNRLAACYLYGVREREIFPLLAERLPTLETLSLTSSSGHSGDHVEHLHAQGALQSGLTNTPRLRELVLSGMYLSLWPHNLSHLTKLSLGRITYDPNDSPDAFLRLFRALEGTPLLEELYILDIGITNLPTEPIPAKVPIQLSNLRIMEVERPSPPEFSQYVLSAITAPPFLSFKFAGWREASPSDVLPRWSPVHPSLPGLADIYDLDVAVACSKCTEMVDITTTGLSHQSKAPVFRIEIVQHSDDILDDTFPSIMEGLHQVLPDMPFLTILSLSNYVPRGSYGAGSSRRQTAQLFTEFLDRHPQIEELSLMSFYDTWTEALVAVTARGHVCPRLRKLTLHRCIHITGETLTDIVTRRAKCNGGHLEELVIYDCLGVDEETVLHIKTLVAQVTFFNLEDVSPSSAVPV